MEMELKDYLELSDYKKAAALAKKCEAEELLQLFGQMDESDIIPLCQELDEHTLAEVLVLLDSDWQKKIIDSLKDEDLEEVMDEVSIDDTLEIIEDLPNETARRIAESDEIIQLLKDRKFPVLKPLLASLNAYDIAEVFEELKDDEMPVLFRLLPKDLAAETFVELESDHQRALIHKLYDFELKAVMDELFVDDTVDLLEEMPTNVVNRLLAQSDADKRNYINDLLKYPKDSAGSVMTVEYVSLRPFMTVFDAFNKIRSTAIDKETIYTCYVTDEKHKLIGYVSAKTLMLASPEALISDIMESNVVYSQTLDDREEVVRKIKNYDFLAMPITDEEKRLVGIITVDDAIDVLETETSEDIAKMAAITPTDKPYLKASVFSIWATRIPWLLVLMVSATFTGLILNTYEERLSAISSVLFACVPMMMDTGGNSGSQASVTVIRALALGDLETKDAFRVLWKEFRASLLLGITLAAACFAKLLLVDNLLFGYSDYTPIRALVVSIALLCTVIVAKIVGCTLPLIAKKCKLDPAVVASPFITTIVDAVSLIVYCSLAVGILA